MRYWPKSLVTDVSALSTGYTWFANALLGQDLLTHKCSLHSLALTRTSSIQIFFLTHKQLDQTSSWGSDITHIHVRANFQKWFATQELSTPENVSQILATAPAVSPYGQGLYVLYVTQGITKIFTRLLRPDPNATDGAMYTFVTDVMCPTSELPRHGTCHEGRGC